MSGLSELFMQLAGHSPLWMLLALAILPGLGFPSIPLLLLCGAWGAALGIPLGIAGLAINSTWTYIIGRCVGLDWIHRLPFSHRLPRPRPIKHWKIIAFVRLLPGIPLFVQNYFLGALRVDYPLYLALSTLFQTFWVIALVTAGVGIVRQHTFLVLIAFALIAVYALIKYLLSRKRGAVDLDDPDEDSTNQPHSTENNPRP